jgi:hypothetical protein
METARIRMLLATPMEGGASPSECPRVAIALLLSPVNWPTNGFVELAGTISHPFAGGSAVRNRGRATHAKPFL